MGRMLGAFDNPQELDRPDLNKCPDCLCYFAQDTCPICGKVCPEEMRAGNRKPPKKQRRRKSSNGRVIFVEWYHSWLAIILFTIFISPVGIILLITSPHKTWQKIVYAVAVIAWYVATSFIIPWVLAYLLGPILSGGEATAMLWLLL